MAKYKKPKMTKKLSKYTTRRNGIVYNYLVARTPAFEFGGHTADLLLDTDLTFMLTENNEMLIIR